MSKALTKELEIRRGQASIAKQKFNYFFIGLTFSVLALAINHGVETDLIASKISELAGWLFYWFQGF